MNFGCRGNGILIPSYSFLANHSSQASQTTPQVTRPNESTPVSERKTNLPSSDQCCDQKNSEYPSKLMEGREVYGDKPNVPVGM